MPYKTLLSLGLILLASLLLAACGSIATPSAGLPPTQEPATLPPRAAQASSGEGEAVAVQPTEVPPTATETPLPPTETPTEAPTATVTATNTPTSVPPTDAPAASSGDAALGEALFHAGKDGAPACTTCHYVDQDAILIGPSLMGIADRAGTRMEGESAEEYLHNSILDPNAYLVPNTDTRVFAAGGASLMFQQYGDYLSDEDVNNLVAYMLTLR
jgi:mono/diheme cytochrome c family protein